MKTLMFVAALCVLSATGAYGQGVAYDPYATNPPLPHSPDVGVFDQGQWVTQHYISRGRDNRRARQKAGQQSLRKTEGTSIDRTSLGALANKVRVDHTNALIRR